MTVAEMIEALNKFDPTDRVVVSGYEAGFDDAAAPALMHIQPDYYDAKDWFFGRHGEGSEIDGERAVLITARSRPS